MRRCSLVVKNYRDASKNGKHIEENLVAYHRFNFFIFFSSLYSFFRLFDPRQTTFYITNYSSSSSDDEHSDNSGPKTSKTKKLKKDPQFSKIKSGLTFEVDQFLANLEDDAKKLKEKFYSEEDKEKIGFTLDYEQSISGGDGATSSSYAAVAVKKKAAQEKVKGGMKIDRVSGWYVKKKSENPPWGDMLSNREKSQIVRRWRRKRELQESKERKEKLAGWGVKSDVRDSERDMLDTSENILDNIRTVHKNFKIESDIGKNTEILRKHVDLLNLYLRRLEG